MRDLLPRACPHPGLTHGRLPQPSPRTLQVCDWAILISGLPESPAEPLTRKAAGEETGSGRGWTSLQPEVQPKVSARTMERGWAGRAAGGRVCKVSGRPIEEAPLQGLLVQHSARVLPPASTSLGPRVCPRAGAVAFSVGATGYHPDWWCAPGKSADFLGPASPLHAVDTKGTLGGGGGRTHQRPGFQSRVSSLLSHHPACVQTRQPLRRDID